MLAHLHELQHEWEDAAHAAEAEAAGLPPSPEEHHDESNCQVHAQLQLPFTASGWVQLLVLLGLFVAFLTCLPAQVAEHHPLARIDCRGPPAC